MLCRVSTKASDDQSAWLTGRQNKSPCYIEGEDRMQFINARDALAAILEQNPALNALEITINSRTLKSEEAIGHPQRDDFPLLRGKEVLLQAEIQGALGQAFVSDPIPYHGSLQNLLDLPDDSPGIHALLVASLNALFSKLGQIEHTIHCIDQDPEKCGEYISQLMLAKHGLCNVGIIGYQPAIVEYCTRVFGPSRVGITDLSSDVVGSIRYGVKVMDGLSDTKVLVDFADVLLITGSILANGTYPDVLAEIGDKPYYFFGTTCAGTAYLNNMNRLCPFSR